MRPLSLLLFFCWILLAACSANKGDADDKKPGFFDLEALISEQVSLLTGGRASLVKEVVYGQQTDQMRLESDELDRIFWQREMMLFSKANINRPAYTRSYQQDTQGQTTRYTALEEDLTTRWIEVTRTADNVLEQVAFHTRTNNPLLHTGMHGRITFAQGQIRAYSLSGFRKPIGADSVIYQVKAHLEVE